MPKAIALTIVVIPFPEIEQFSIAVTARLKEGWQLHGTTFAVDGGVAQALVYYEEKRVPLAASDDEFYAPPANQ